MPPKRKVSATRARSRTRSRTRSRSRSQSLGAKAPRSRSAAPAAAEETAAAGAGSAVPVVETPVFNEPKQTAPSSAWEADAKLMDAMSSGRSHVRSSGVRKLLRGKKVHVWGYWIAIIVFQVVMIVWAKWAVDMYKQYRSKAH
ncbi:hypothetical protein N2W54_004375 [Lotmaria passim]